MADIKEKVVRYGQLSLVIQGVKAAMGDAIGAIPEYTLPKASQTVMGGVLVGDNISVSGSGVISVPVATPATAGVITETRVGEIANVKIKEAINQFVGEAPEAFDTLQEIGTWIGEHEDAYELLVNAVTNKADKATTLAGYGITDAKIEGGKITLGNQTITPLTQHQSLANYLTTAAASSTYATKTDLNAKAAKSDVESLKTKVESLEYMTDTEAEAMVAEIFG